MTQKVARYSVTNGLSGCYMPDNAGGPYFFHTRRELADMIRAELDVLDWPASMMRQVPLRRIWSHIQRHGSSVAHFSVTRGGYELAFHGLTAAEAAQMEADCDA